MWIFTIYGFYSIACADKPGTKEIDPDTVMVQARVKKHLQNLQRRFPVLAKTKILTWLGRDYSFRLIVPKAVWVDALKELAVEQTWSNFKDEATAREAEVGGPYIDKLHEEWRTMLRLQESGKRSYRDASMDL